MTDERGRADELDALDYRLIFQAMPGMCLILDASFKILAQNDEHARTTLSIARNVVGRNLFEAFPDNPNDSNASGVASVRQSSTRRSWARTASCAGSSIAPKTPPK